jgi:steroid 5-alpha reductase family enzyme
MFNAEECKFRHNLKILIRKFEVNDLAIMILGPILLIHLFYAVAVATKNLSVIDTAWGLGFILLAAMGCYLSGFSSSRENVLALMVMIWGLRLAIFIHSRNSGKGEDFRYANWRKDWGEKTNLIAYFKVYWLQLVLMAVVGLPIFAVHENRDNIFNPIHILGVGIWLFGLMWESIADYQKLLFKKIPGNEHKVFQDGLWKYSRHPNYFGEATLWWGIALVSVNQGHYLGLIGSAFITFLLLKVSGVPLVEKKQEHNPEYQIYASHTPVFIPDFSKVLNSLR